MENKEQKKVRKLYWEKCLVRTTKRLIAIKPTKICCCPKKTLVISTKVFFESTKWVWLVLQNFCCLNQNLVGTIPEVTNFDPKVNQNVYVRKKIDIYT